MKRAILPLLLLITAACASAPQKVPGRYGLFFDPALSRGGRLFNEQIAQALRDRLGTVDVVDSFAASGYDAVVVLRPGGTVIASTAHPDRKGPIVYDRDGRPVHAWESPRPYTSLVEFDVLRDGQSVSTGVVRLDSMNTDPIERSGPETIRPVNPTNPYSQSRQIAMAVTYALKRSAS